MNITHAPRAAAWSIAIILFLAGAASARALGHEAQLVIDTLLVQPAIKAEAGFTAKMLVAPGELYDPLFMVRGDDTVWMNDDGKATDGHGSRILSVSSDGKISTLIGADKLLPVTGFDIAPRGFGNYGGQIFSIAQPTAGMKGALANHVIQRIELGSHSASTFCTLPASGNVGKGIAGYGVDARFGPPRSSFANRFYSITALNDMIYQTMADGSCKPFANLSAVGAPAGLTFTADGSAMLVTVSPGEIVSSRKERTGMIVRVTPDGKLDPKPVVTGLTTPMGLAIAPPGFGSFAGQIFVNDLGEIQAPVPQTQALKRDGRVYRVTKDGELKIVASGFVNPAGARFIGNHLWVTDINGDFIAGTRELPDGFLVQIDAR
jgi:hypothetical protein